MYSVQTYSGRVLDFANPQMDQIHIEDIAHALSHVCRFSGNLTQFYSVGAHSLNVTGMVPAEHKLQALLHDATEAYMGDLPKPLKRLCRDFQQIEDNLWEVIANKYCVPTELHDSVKLADMMMLKEESDRLLLTGPRDDLWQDIRNIPNGNMFFLEEEPNKVRDIFLEKFESLTKAVTCEL